MTERETKKARPPVKYVPAEELRALGILQEVNRQFFHPLGLALDVLVDSETGKATGLGGIQDHRKSPGGVVFGNSMLSKEKAKAIRDMRKANISERKKLFDGVVMQPITE